MAVPSSPRPAVRFDEFTLVAGGRTLLDCATLIVREGELVLLVGASGSGKSLTLSLMLGLLGDEPEIATSGVLEVFGADPRRTGPAPGTAAVFQDFALFDDWDAGTNVAFAADHGGSTDAVARAALVRREIEDSRLPATAKPGRMSGGQKQRLAIARALASQPAVIFYDEPTSGLDPALSADTAQRLRAAHDRGGMTSVVVTHDLPALAPVADRIVLLDPVARTFRDVPKDGAAAALEALRGFHPPEPAPVPRKARSFVDLPGFALDATGRAVLALLDGLGAVFTRSPRRAWGARFLRYYAGLLAFGSALPFLCVAAAVAGFIVSFFLFRLVPYAGFTEPVLVEEITASLGYALYRVVAPGTLALLFAARGGAAAAADFGRRSYARQLDALRVQGVDPRRYLLAGALRAALMATPVLWFLAWKCASAAAAVVFLATHPRHGAWSFDATFGRLVDDGAWWSRHTAWSLGKTLVCVFGTVVVAWRVGMKRPASGAELSRAVTTSVIRSVLWTLFVQLAFAFVEF